MRRQLSVVFGAGLTVGAARFMLAYLFAGNFPTSDLYDGNFRHIYRPFVDGSLNLRSFIQAPAGGEHIQAIPRLLDFALFWVTGEWNLTRECELHALIAAAIAAALVDAHLRLSAAGSALTVASICLLLALPVCFYNTLVGTGDVYTLCLLVSVLPFSAPSAGEFPRRGLNLASGWAICAYLSSGSGLITFAIVSAMAAWAYLTRGIRPVASAFAVYALICVGFFALAFLLFIHFGVTTRPLVPRGKEISSVHEFVINLRDHIFWPGWPLAWIGIAIWLPFGVVAWRLWADRSAPQTPDHQSYRFAFMLYAWVLAIILATALLRPYYAGAGVQYRYFDILLMAALAAYFTPRWKLPRAAVPALKIAVVGLAALFASVLWPQVESLSKILSTMEKIERETFRIERESSLADARAYFVMNSAHVQMMVAGATEGERVNTVWDRMHDPAYMRIRGHAAQLENAKIYRFPDDPLK